MIYVIDVSSKTCCKCNNNNITTAVLRHITEIHAIHSLHRTGHGEQTRERDRERERVGAREKGRESARERASKREQERKRERERERELEAGRERVGSVWKGSHIVVLKSNKSTITIPCGQQVITYL